MDVRKLLSELDDLLKEVTPHLRATIPPASVSFGRSSTNFPSEFRRPDPWVSIDKVYCPVCAKDRSVKVNVLVHTGPLTRLARSKPNSSKYLIDTSEFGPSLIVFTCEQCALNLNCLVFDESVGGLSSTKLMVFPSEAGGLSTEHTPEEIKHFVDEAYKCQCVGANGAAIEMCRVALEQLLHEQGYKDGMLNKMIEALEADQKAGGGKSWATDLDVDMLHVLRKLGNVVAHPDDVTALRAFDTDTIIGLQEVFQFLLADIYELPFAQKQSLTSFREMRELTLGD